MNICQIASTIFKSIISNFNFEIKLNRKIFTYGFHCGDVIDFNLESKKKAEEESKKKEEEAKKKAEEEAKKREEEKEEEDWEDDDWD